MSEFFLGGGGLGVEVVGVWEVQSPSGFRGWAFWSFGVWDVYGFRAVGVWDLGLGLGCMLPAQKSFTPKSHTRLTDSLLQGTVPEPKDPRRSTPGPKILPELCLKFPMLGLGVWGLGLRGLGLRGLGLGV